MLQMEFTLMQMKLTCKEKCQFVNMYLKIIPTIQIILKQKYLKKIYPIFVFKFPSKGNSFMTHFTLFIQGSRQITL